MTWAFDPECSLVSATPAAGGGRWVEVPAERVAGWLAGFEEQHQVVRTISDGATLRVEGADGEVAECHTPFPPLPETGERPGLWAEPLLAHVQRDRTVGVLLVRLGGHAAGVFEGDRLVASRVGARPVHGRHANGGWSQQRFARRREGQAREAGRAAADLAAGVLLPRLRTLEAVVLGGDRHALDPLREDRRLAPIFELAVERFLATPDPRLAVLLDTPRAFRAVRVRLV